MALDERLRRELDGAGRPADPTGVYEELIRRRERRRMVRKVQQVALAAVVLGGSLGLILALTLVFRPGGGEGTIEPAPPGLPTNGEIVFSRPVEGGGASLFAANPDGSGLREVTPGAGSEQTVLISPDVSPDGRTIAVEYSPSDFTSDRKALATFPIDGSPGSVLLGLAEPWVVQDPAWSPDGTRIAFAGSPSGSAFGIYIFELDSGRAHLVPDTDAMKVADPTWSPDGSRIAFAASTDPDTDPNQQWDIYSIAVGGSDLVNLTNTPDSSEGGPTWSWANDRIAFIGGGSLLTMAADGTDVRMVYSGDLAPAHPAWAPDGTAIAFNDSSLGDEGVFTIHPGGTGLSAVTGPRAWQPTWRPVPDDGDPPAPPTDPSLLPSPTTPPEDPRVTDVGLGLQLCDVSSVRGTFLGAYPDSIAFVGAEPTASGRCRLTEEMSGVIAIDLSGDGVADIASEPFSCQTQCGAFAAPDVDGDGTDELLAINVGFSVVGLNLFDVVPNGDEPAIVPVMVEPPGDAAIGYQGFDGSGVPQFWIGGDGFGADALRCDTVDGRRVLVSSTGQMVPPDSPDAVWEVHETTFVLEDGVLRVIGARDYEATEADAFTGTGGCGADLSWP